MNKTTDTSQKVMDRIMNENKWALPAHKQENKISKKIRMVSLLVSILFLVGISVSFIYTTPTASSEEKMVASVQSENVVTVIKPTDFAKTFSNLDFVGVKGGMVASIGEPKIYQTDDKGNSDQTLLVLSILGIATITLFLSWLSGENQSDHT